MKGLSFSAPMVIAWMEGRKLVTRRLMNPQPVFDENGGVWYPHSAARKAFHYASESHFRKGVAVDFGRVLTGETVYIKETWQNNPFGGIVYKAGSGIVDCDGRGWKSPRFMPEWAARSHALIVSVRPERVQEISGFEAVLEGFGKGIPEFELLHYGGYKKARKEFIETWESLHPGSWEKNEWCWRIELNKEAE